MTNILVFSTHPDDAEFSIGGTILKHSKKYKITIVILTNGEAAKNGDKFIRKKEAMYLTEINQNIKVKFLNFKDGFVNSNSKYQLNKIIEIIRKLRPSIIISPYWKDSHPDHREASKLIKCARYKASINILEKLGNPFFCKFIYFYSLELINDSNKIYIDISEYLEMKKELVNNFNSQLCKEKEYEYTYINNHILNKIISKDIYCGTLINTIAAEELLIENYIKIDNLFSII